MNKLAVLLMFAVIVAQFSSTEAWGGRRRRRRCHIPGKPAGHRWANVWDGPMNFECPHGQSINKIYSIYSSCHKDRVWSFKCKYNSASRADCDWGYPANNWDGLLNFHCTHNGFITGIKSNHHNHYEDRQYRFRCCNDVRYLKYNCKTTPFHQNTWRGMLNYVVPHGYYLTGITSRHDNNQEDRVWQFERCRIKFKPRGKRELLIPALPMTTDKETDESNAEDAYGSKYADNAAVADSFSDNVIDQIDRDVDQVNDVDRDVDRDADQIDEFDQVDNADQVDEPFAKAKGVDGV